MGSLKLEELKLQRLFCIKMLSKLLDPVTVIEQVTFIIYLGQLILTLYPLIQFNTAKVGEGVVLSITQDNVLFSIVKMRNALAHYNVTAYNNAVFFMDKLELNNYLNTELYPYMLVLKTFNWEEISELYLNVTPPYSD